MEFKKFFLKKAVRNEETDDACQDIAIIEG